VWLFPQIREGNNEMGGLERGSLLPAFFDLDTCVDYSPLLIRGVWAITPSAGITADPCTWAREPFGANASRQHHRPVRDYALPMPLREPFDLVPIPCAPFWLSVIRASRARG